jgi:hypothetical protein
MAFVGFTRADNAPVTVNTAEIVSGAPVPKSGPLMGALEKGTRIVFRDGSRPDAVETVARAEKTLNAAGWVRCGRGRPVPATRREGRGLAVLTQIQDSVRVSALGESTQGLFEVGGQYRGSK